MNSHYDVITADHVVIATGASPPVDRERWVARFPAVAVGEAVEADAPQNLKLEMLLGDRGGRDRRAGEPAQPLQRSPIRFTGVRPDISSQPRGSASRHDVSSRPLPGSARKKAFQQ